MRKAGASSSFTAERNFNSSSRVHFGLESLWPAQVVPQLKQKNSSSVCVLMVWVADVTAAEVCVTELPIDADHPTDVAVGVVANTCALLVTDDGVPATDEQSGIVDKTQSLEAVLGKGTGKVRLGCMKCAGDCPGVISSSGCHASPPAATPDMSNPGGGAKLALAASMASMSPQANETSWSCVPVIHSNKVVWASNGMSAAWYCSPSSALPSVSREARRSRFSWRVAFLFSCGKWQKVQSLPFWQRPLA
mmetsp:Transcript_17663/g.41042  ORF Transcript_17663/g.41042 Transcript_17663/m.41042 type:complete len:249 (+) Transcript_17663:169-915(+)